MTHASHNSEPTQTSQEPFEHMVRERLRQAVRQVLIDVLEEEVTTIIGAGRYQRCESRRDQRNGYYQRDLAHEGGRDCGFASSSNAQRASDTSVPALSPPS